MLRAKALLLHACRRDAVEHTARFMYLRSLRLSMSYACIVNRATFPLTEIVRPTAEAHYNRVQGSCLVPTGRCHSACTQ